MITQTKIFVGALVGLVALIASTVSETATQAPFKVVTPAGIFTQNHLPSYDPDAAAYDDIDAYTPYRSDVHDIFSWKLIKAVLEDESQNVMISPFSVKLVLAILSEAAGNNTLTEKELVATLTDIQSPDNLRFFYKKVLFSLKKENPYHVLNLETRLFVDAFIKPEQRYAATAYSFYDTKIEPLQFADARTSANCINAWSANVTRGHLKQLVTEDNIQNNVMLIANVIYFHGLWRRPFNDTYRGVFFRDPNQQQQVEYMELTENFYYFESTTLNAKILRLPYKGKKFAMFILLPTSKGGVEELTHILENDQLKNMQWMMEEQKVKVTLPKFKFDFNKNLKDTLRRLGINEIFTDNASLPGLARGSDVAGKLKVSNVFQKAGIEVNEQGTEAYAATVLEIENKFGGSSTVEEFNVNRPFIFFIEDDKTGNLIFAGKVLEPRW